MTAVEQFENKSRNVSSYKLMPNEVRRRRLRFDFDLIHKTPHPVLAWFDGLHDGVFRGVEMFGGMLVLG
jgi:hypothetical protein